MKATGNIENTTNADKKLLIVDDNDTARSTTIIFLNSLGFKKVDEADNGMEAFKAIVSKKPDLVIVDWNMPYLNGLELVNAIKAIERFGATKFLMVTSRSGKDDLLEAMNAKVDSYIVKPFSFEVLKKKIYDLIH